MEALMDLDAVVGRAVARAMQMRRLPESTYRVQFHKGFTFRDAAAIVPYLAELGVTHLYASPYLRARPGSTHGYDVIDHASLNPELGTREDFEALLAALERHGMSHILDTVPNHVGVATNDNAWWNDVLENGPLSRFANYFDIAWRGSPRAELHDKVLLPVLGGQYGDVLEKGELRLAYADGALAVHYYDRRFPIWPGSYGDVLGHRAEELVGELGAKSTAAREYQEVVAAIDRLPRVAEDVGDDAAREANFRGQAAIKGRLAALIAGNPAVRRFVEQNIATFNGSAGEPRSFDRLDALLGRQFYRLAYWRVASDEINYRRFFDINDLAALSMEREEVFEATHALVLGLLAEGKLAGLRIDHPDGLYDPEQYFRRLQRQHVLNVARSDPALAGTNWDEVRPALVERIERALPERGSGRVEWPAYVVAEKILAPDEPLPPHWAVDGTSGYDFLNKVNGVFVDTAAEGVFTRIYHDLTADATPFADLVYGKKRLILEISLASELQMLARQMDGIAQGDRHARDFTHNGLRHALREVIACFPVYRSYVTDRGLRESDVAFVEVAVERAIARNPKTDASVFHFIRDTLLLRRPAEMSEAQRRERVRFAGKFQQVTAPTTAKGIEDTAFYIYNRFVSLNEVGGEPDHFGVSPDDLHAYLKDRQARWPYALSALSTHDTKRSEDVRARLNVLSEIPEEWGEAVRRWAGLNEGHRTLVDGRMTPGPSEEYLMYQTLVGAWPLEGGGDAAFVERIGAYMEKALREAKVFTSWTDPNGPYEEAVGAFVGRILNEKTGGAFLADFVPFQRRIAEWGLVNSLAQTVLRIAAPGVPDTYQGTEVWDFSLVDPDNRRPVDYARRRAMLEDLKARIGSAGLVEELVATRRDGRLKMLVTLAALAARRQYAGLFSAGEYEPLQASGSRGEHVFAFMRRAGGRVAVVVVPRLVTTLSPAGEMPVGERVWGGTEIAFKGGGGLRNVITGGRVSVAGRDGYSVVRVADVLSALPVAVLVSEE